MRLSYRRDSERHDRSKPFTLRLRMMKQHSRSVKFELDSPHYYV
jgi:hypothetical protein